MGEKVGTGLSALGYRRWAIGYRTPGTSGYWQ
jgi:hypothetical protein